MLGERRKKVEEAWAGSKTISPFFQGENISPANRFLCPHFPAMELLCLPFIMNISKRRAKEVEEEENKQFQQEKETSRPYLVHHGNHLGQLNSLRVSSGQHMGHITESTMSWPYHQRASSLVRVPSTFSCSFKTTESKCSGGRMMGQGRDKSPSIPRAYPNQDPHSLSHLYL